VIYEYEFVDFLVDILSEMFNGQLRRPWDTSLIGEWRLCPPLADVGGRSLFSAPQGAIPTSPCSVDYAIGQHPRWLFVANLLFYW